MAKLSKEELARREGALWAIGLVRDKGYDKAVEELKYRGIYEMPIGVNNADLQRFNQYAKDNCIKTITALCAWAMRDTYGFGRKRIDRFIKAVNHKAEMLEGGWCCWEDIVQVMQDETHIHFSIPDECKRAEEVNSIGVEKK